eukprot:TRINITY_DN258_c0_g1_i1.p1 TRINITY_DN258_c0_g1~~TRINITY_DN258_c0_g1_i1.p1  ORF type:complete len:1046 (-),score=35.87 TRINITY_DN258_c0_g1_i1:10813-13857(-)
MEKNSHATYKGESCWGTFTFFIKHSSREICRRLCYFMISLLSCYLAISVALVANTVIGNAPLLFLRMTEINQGEIDLTILPGNDNTTFPRFLNCSRMDELVGGAALLAPRMVFRDTIAYTDKSRPYNLTMLLLDSEREKTLEIGRKYQPPVLVPGDCAIHRNLANFLGVSIGDTFTVGLTIPEYINVLNALVLKGGKTFPVLAYDYFYKFQCKVGAIYSSLEGKVPSGEDDAYFYMEYNHFLKQFANSTNTVDSPFSSEFSAYLQNLDPYQIATEVNTNHPKRMTVYKNNDFDEVQTSMTSFASRVLDKVGFFPVETNMPLLTDLQGLSMAAVFLGIIMNLVVIILAAISSYLIYSLLMISFDTRIFEMGIFRLTGLRKYALCALVIIQALLFVLPALLLGIATSFFYLWAVCRAFEQSVQFTFTPVPTTTAFIWAICVGLIVPLLASFVPIRNVLNKTLNASIDMAHSKSQGVHITIEFAQKGINWNLVAFGIIAIAFGLTVYYLLPLSLLAMDFQLMLWLMLSILLALFIGLVMLALNVQHLIDKLIVYVVLFFETAYMKLVILKNLVAHKIRNRRTGIIFAVVIGFLLFIVVGYTMELENAELTMLMRHGAYLDVNAKRGHTIPFDVVIAIEEVLDKNEDIVEGYSWIAEGMTQYQQLRLKDNWIMDYGRLYKYKIQLNAVPPNFFDVSNQKFISVFQSNETTSLSLSEQLYTPRGSQGIGVGSFLANELGINAEDPKSTFLLSFERLGPDVAYESRAIFLLNSCPALRMSRRLRSSQAAVMSYPLYLQLSNATSFTTLAYESVSIKAKGDSTEHYDKLYDELVAVTANMGANVTVWSYSTQAENIESIKKFLDMVFYIIIGLFMLLFVFSLVSSMTANVLEQVKELAVLRAIGMTKWRGAMLYAYEAFVLVLSSSLIGCIIGMIVGYSLSLQRNLYTDLPIEFHFPWVHLVVIVGCSIVCAGISAVSPAVLILTQSVAMLAKSQSIVLLALDNMHGNNDYTSEISILPMF